MKWRGDGSNVRVTQFDYCSSTFRTYVFDGVLIYFGFWWSSLGCKEFSWMRSSKGVIFTWLRRELQDVGSGEDFGKDSVERDERRLTELGRRTVEMFVLAHLYTYVSQSLLRLRLLVSFCRSRVGISFKVSYVWGCLFHFVGAVGISFSCMPWLIWASRLLRWKLEMILAYLKYL